MYHQVRYYAWVVFIPLGLHANYKEIIIIHPSQNPNTKWPYAVNQSIPWYISWFADAKWTSDFIIWYCYIQCKWHDCTISELTNLWCILTESSNEVWNQASVPSRLFPCKSIITHNMFLNVFTIAMTSSSLASVIFTILNHVLVIVLHLYPISIHTIGFTVYLLL